MRLESELVRVTLDPNSGGFSSIYDKRSGREYVGASDRALLFRLIAPNETLAGNPIDAAGAEIAVEETTARLAYELDGADVVVSLALDEAAVTASLRLTNTGPLTIEETIFPWVRGLAPMPDATLIWPNLWVRRFSDIFGKGLGSDHLTWEWGGATGQKVVSRYPFGMASAWIDYGNTVQGFALEGRHTDFSIMDFYIHKIIDKTFDPIRRTLDIALVHPRRVRPGETYDTPPVRLSLHQGDWHVVADEHRNWLETWIERPKVSPKFAESIGWHFYFMKNQDGVVWNTYEDLGRMAEAALSAGCPYLLVFGWQVGGHDNNYMYRYVANEEWGGAKALKEALEQVRKMGVEVIPFFNGTLANVEMPEHKEFGHKWELKTRGGYPLYAGDWARFTFDAPMQNRSMHHHEICPCEEHQAYFLETVERIVREYAFGNIQLDQIACKNWPCYNEDHGHSHPDRAYVDGFANLLSKTRELVCAANPEGVMLSEGLNEFAGQWCDGSWDWRTLLFPEPVLYTLPWVFMSHEIDALEYGAVNLAFAYKMHLDLKIDGGFSAIDKYPRFVEHVKRNAELRRRVRDYYVYADFRDEEGVFLTGAENSAAKVFHNKAEAKIGVVLVETEGATADITLKIAWKTAGTIRCDSNTGNAGSIEPTSEVALTLQPNEVRVFCIDLAR